MSLPEPISQIVRDLPIRWTFHSDIEGLQKLSVDWKIRTIDLEIMINRSVAEDVEGHTIDFTAKSLFGFEKDKEMLKSLLHRNNRYPVLFFDRGESMSLIIWNCRGAGNPLFRTYIRHLINSHRPDAIVLTETKIPYDFVVGFFNSLGFTANSIADPFGRVGGIWLIWNPTKISFNTFVISNQEVRIHVSYPDYEDWIVSVLYASPNPSFGNLLWEDVRSRGNFVNIPSIIGGDFDDFAEAIVTRSFTQVNGQIKLNTGGVSRGSPGIAGYGGIFRDNCGSWIIGFYGRMHSCSSLEAKLWGLYKGFRYIIQQGLEDILVESDCSEAVDLILQGPPSNFCLRNLVIDCATMRARSNSKVGYILQEVNRVAEKLANIGVDQELNMKIIELPPACIEDLLHEDLLG